MNSKEVIMTSSAQPTTKGYTTMFTPEEIKDALRIIAKRDGRATREDAIEYLYQMELDYSDQLADQLAEMRAEFGMSWVCGGGSAEDVSAAWSMHRDDYIAGRIG